MELIRAALAKHKIAIWLHFFQYVAEGIKSNTTFSSSGSKFSLVLALSSLIGLETVQKMTKRGKFSQRRTEWSPAALIKNTEDIHAEIMIFLVLVNDRESIKAKAIKCRSDNSFVSNSF